MSSNVDYSWQLIVIHKNILKFITSISGSLALSSADGVTLSGKQIGRWEHPFGLKMLAIENIQLGIGISPIPPVSNFNAGGTMIFGNIGSANVIKATAYIGLGINPSDTYLYAEVKPFALVDIIKAFNFNADGLSQSLLDTGFPEGISMSFSFAESKY